MIVSLRLFNWRNTKDVLDFFLYPILLQQLLGKCGFSTSTCDVQRSAIVIVDRIDVYSGDDIQLQRLLNKYSRE
eukprot:m.566257 g.566257  ORF g.566257 m.566257 type:complete len:74 (-) comp22248_c0_seq14:2172-2393(-)